MGILLADGSTVGPSEIQQYKRDYEARFSLILQRVYGVGEIHSTERGGFTCACPLHGGSDSHHFAVSSRGLWACYSGDCGTGLDVIAFIQRAHQCTFTEAVKIMVEEVGGCGHFNPPPQPPPAPRRPFTEEQIATFLRDHPYWRRTSDDAKRLLEGGYCDDSQHRLFGRVTFPVRDIDGTLVGVIGRVTTAEMPIDLQLRIDSPVYRTFMMEMWERRYLNIGPDIWKRGRWCTGGFDTGPHLLHLHRARYTRGPLLLVEGPFDVAAVISAGYTGVVGLMGSALTKARIAILRGLNRPVIYALDGDTWRDAKARTMMADLTRAGIKVAPLRLPDEEDMGGQSPLAVRWYLKRCLETYGI